MRKWLSLGAMLCAAALVLVILRLYRAAQKPESAFATPIPTKTAGAGAASPSPSLSPEKLLDAQADRDFMAGRVNLLLLGYDESPERDEEDTDVYRGGKNGFRSDVLALLAVDFNRGAAHLISIPRDTYAQIYNTRGRWKINAAFAKGGGAEGEGYSYAMKTVELLLGVPVEYYAGVNMEGMKRLVDAMGGVDYDVDISFVLNGRTLAKGRQRLSGQQALDYCRVRKGISTDVGRVNRQQRLLLAIFHQLQSTGELARLPKLYNAVKDDVTTNLSLSQIAALASFALHIDDGDLKRTTLEGEYVSNVYNASYYVLENKKLAALVKEEFGVDIKRDKKYDLATVKRDKAAALAKKAAEKLKEAETLLTLPTDSSAALDRLAVDRARAARSRLLAGVEQEASQTELRLLTDAYYRAVKSLIERFGATRELSGLFPLLRLESGSQTAPGS